LRRLRGSSIGLQFASIVVASVAATTGVVAAAAFANARRFALSEAQRRVELTAVVEALRLRDIIVEKSRAITNWSRLEVMRALIYGDVDKQIVEFLERSVAGSPEDVASVCMDRSGSPVAGVGDARIFTTLASASASPFEIITVDGRRFLRFSAPVAVADAPEQVLGRIDLLVDPSVLLNKRSAGPTHDLTLRSPDGGFVAGGAFQAAATSEETGSEDWIIASAPIRLPDPAAGNALVLEAAEPARVALAPARAMQQRIVVAGLIVLALASLIGTTIAVRISRPIRRFTAAVEGIRERGRLAGSIDVPTGPGELGVLAEAFTRMARTLAIAEERNVAQSRLALLGEVAANIAHEVRTPLASLRSAGQMLAVGNRDRATTERLASLIVSEADRLDNVVTNLVRTARPPLGIRKRSNLMGLIARAVATLDPLLIESGRTIDVRGPTATITVDVDPDQIQQVLLNLLRNALDASAVTNEVSVEVSEQGHVAVIEVRDSGSGFAASVLERPFAPFHTTKATGTGLGLAIVRRIVEEHGGQVSIGNIDGGGACVSVRLPKVTAA